MPQQRQSLLLGVATDNKANDERNATNEGAYAQHHDEEEEEHELGEFLMDAFVVDGYDPTNDPLHHHHELDASIELDPLCMMV